MNKISEEIMADPTLMRALILGLTIECPFGGNPESCLACDIRKLQLDEKKAWLKSLPDNECRKIYLQHLECRKEKE